MCILKNFRCVALIPVILHYLEFCKNAIGEVIVSPTDKEAVLSESATLKCRSNIKTQFPVAWYYLQLGGNKYNKLLYEDGSFSYENGHENGNGNGNGHLRNYGISGNTSAGEFNLVISNVMLQNAGRYTCVDTSRSERRAELNVYESNLNCETNQPPDGFIGANDFGIIPDTVRFSCNVSYRGNLKPELEWKQGNETLRNATVERNDSFIMSSIELRADEITSPDFQCRIRYLNSNLESKFIWLTTLHFLVLDTRTKIYSVSCSESPIQPVDCAIATLHQCSYTWKKSNSNWSISGSTFNFASADEVAVYTCHAECLVRGTNCSFTPAQVAYTCAMNGYVDQGGAKIAAIIISILVAGGIIAIVVLIIRRRRQLLNSNVQPPPQPEEELRLETSGQTSEPPDEEFQIKTSDSHLL